MDQPVPNLPQKGRGSISNRSGRFEVQKRHAIDDDWTRDEAVPPPTTSLREDTSRTIIVRNTSPDVPFDRSINPYRGCEHGCVYCFARPTHAYLGLSPGLGFETRLFFKPAAAFQKRVEQANGSRSNLPEPADKPEIFGSARQQPRHY